MKWRPIKTAPKDKLILLAQPPYNPAEHKWVVLQGRWIDLPHVNEVCKLPHERPDVSKIKGAWIACYHGIMDVGGAWNGKAYDERPLNMYPTHWMPLPKPPTGRFKQPRT